jgi:nucleoside-diphosphate-sugar epimerase
MEEVRYQFSRPFVADSSAFQETFGLAPTPLETTFDETVAWWRARLPA